jgi:lipoyl(octanoyl) transferase
MSNFAVLQVRELGLQDYTTTWHAMQAFTQQRSDATLDEVWLVEHPAVYTLGLNGDPAHVRATGNIPIINTDRGGQVTYHGPGQLVVYPLLDLQRRRLGVRHLVEQLEQAVIDCLREYGIAGQRRARAPGVYVADAKIAALGLRVRRGRSYHGLAFNIAMDLMPFSQINPCGYANLAVTDLAALLPAGAVPDAVQIKQQLVGHFCRLLGYNAHTVPTRNL